MNGRIPRLSVHRSTNVHRCDQRCENCGNGEEVWLSYPPWCIGVTVPSKKDVVSGVMTILDDDALPLIPCSRTVEADAKISIEGKKGPPFYSLHNTFFTLTRGGALSHQYHLSK